MPRVYSPEMMLSQEDLERLYGDDEDVDLFAVPPEAFQYLPPPELGGPEAPVYVTVRPDQIGKIARKPSLFEKMFGEQRRAPPPPNPWQIETEGEAAKLAAAMAALGAARAYVRYDGGNDEGFAWFDHCVFADGATRDGKQIQADLRAAGAIGSKIKPFPDYDPLDEIASLWAIRVLGESYGTGEYVMYGAFWVDLTTGLTTDDPNPAPVVQNISFKA